jgi:hypothetical protein
LIILVRPKFLTINMSRPEPSIFGFTLLRNGVKYDYPFVASLNSLAGIAEKIFVALGKSEDTTLQEIEKIAQVELVHTIWDESLRSGGLILSQQTNVALDALRLNLTNNIAHSWGIYLQCDEVLHQEDMELIRSDIERADKEGADAVAFRYLHFWQEHDAIAINKKWYPHELRAIKLDSTIKSWGDAQSFTNCKKIFYSEARIFHYGHVREAEKYLLKKADILKLYHLDQKLQKYKNREKRFDEQTLTLRYCGDHPQWMKERIINLGGTWQFPQVEEVLINGNKANFSKNIIERINAKKVSFISSKVNNSIDFDSFDSVPMRMYSKLARPWSNDFRLTLLLSQAGVGLCSE